METVNTDLLEKIKHNRKISDELSEACKSGDVAQVRHFIAQDLPPDIYRSALRSACFRNWEIVCVAELISVCGLQSCEFLQMAAGCGSKTVLTVLIGVCDPKTDNSDALQAAALHGQYRCMKLLYPVSDVETALTKLRARDDSPATRCGIRMLEEYHAEQIKIKLCEALDDVEPARLVSARRI